jgi:hypothetical protein
MSVAKQFVERFYPHVAERLEYLRQCATPAAIERAYEILHELASLTEKRHITFPEPLTFGDADDGIQYEWRNKGREFHLDIMPDSDTLRYEFLMCESMSLHEGKEGDAGDLNQPLDSSLIILEFLSWVEMGLFTKEAVE